MFFYFQLACRSEVEQRALELMELLKDDRLLPLAAKYASRLGRMHLADKLTNLADTWEKEAEKLNIAQNSHFNDLDTQETYDVTNTEQDLNTSLILAPKVKEKKVNLDTSIKPVVGITGLCLYGLREALYAEKYILVTYFSYAVLKINK